MKTTFTILLSILSFTYLFSYSEKNAEKSLENLLLKHTFNNETNFESLSEEIQGYSHHEVFSYIESNMYVFYEGSIEPKKQRNISKILYGYIRNLNLVDLAEKYESYSKARGDEFLKIFSDLFFSTVRSTYSDKVYKERGINIEIDTILSQHPIFVSDLIYFEPLFFRSLIVATERTAITDNKTASVADKLPYYDAIYLRSVKLAQPTDPKLEDVIEGDVPHEAIARFQNWEKVDY